jgi:hypothetical protein
MEAQSDGESQSTTLSPPGWSLVGGVRLWGQHNRTFDGGHGCAGSEARHRCCKPRTISYVI